MCIRDSSSNDDEQQQREKREQKEQHQPSQEAGGRQLKAVLKPSKLTMEQASVYKPCSITVVFAKQLQACTTFDLIVKTQCKQSHVSHEEAFGILMAGGT